MNRQNSALETPSGPKEQDPLFQQPRITLVDMDDSVQKVLRQKGYASRNVSFGKRFPVVRQNELYPHHSIPDVFAALGEEEIIVADLKLQPLDSTQERLQPREGVNFYWSGMSRGLIDPRPLAMFSASAKLDRILDHGGVFVCFIDSRIEYEFTHGHVGYHRTVDAVGDPLVANTWSMLSILSSNEWISVDDDQGNVISISSNLSSAQLLRKHLKEAKFLCTIKPSRRLKNEFWTCLAQNKFGSCVAAQIECGPGLIFLLPDLADKAAFVADFITEYLPEVRPDLFPHSAGKMWIREPPYEFQRIIDLQAEIDQVERTALQRKAELEEDIAKMRLSKNFEYALLTETGDTLKEAVIFALALAGFTQVVNVDEELKNKGEKRDLGEDAQILDSNPILLVEIKGIAGMPADEDVLAVHKYLAPRMKEWKKTNVKGLCILNHQRNLPALQRDDNLMREDLSTSVDAQDIGLLTTWDLFRLVRSKEKLRWNDKFVKPIFLRTGRIDPIPEHYEFVGTVTKFKDDICGVEVQAATVNEGDTLAFELQVEFEEQAAISIEIEGKPVMVAALGKVFGLKTTLAKGDILGARVFRVKHWA